MYKGNWLGGKQHGLGLYTVPGQEVRCGLWEEGKRIEWFDKAQVYQIETGRLDYRNFFRKVKYAEEAPMIGQFTEPTCFEQRLDELHRRFPLKPFKLKNQANQ